MTQALPKSLVEQLVPFFEDPRTNRPEPKTLEEYVSHEFLQEGLPRILPDLFAIKREARPNLTLDQIKKIDSLKPRMGSYIESHDPNYDDGQIYVLLGAEHDVKILEREFSASIPMFFYALHDEKIVTINQSVICKYKLDFPVALLYESSERRLRRDLRAQSYFDFPFKLDCNARVPEIPTGFIEISDEAIAEYYDIVKKAPMELRKKTRMTAPKVGILWAPTDESLYATGGFPRPEPRRMKGDPALILDIDCGGRSYKHVLALWDIGEELPFRNWLKVYCEGR